MTPVDPSLLGLLQQARDAAASGQFAAAENLYRRARTQAPDDPLIALSLGHVLRQLQRPAEAKPLFAAAATAKPDMAEAQLALAMACHDMGDLAGAEAGFRAAAARNPAMLPATIGLAVILNQTARPDEALAALAKIDTQDRNVQAAIEQARGMAWFLKEDNQAALAHFERVLTLAPGHPEARHWRGRALDLLGREEEALAALRQLVADVPSHMAAHQDLNQLLYRLKRDAEYLSSYDEAARKLPRMMPHFALAKAALLVRGGRAEEALAQYDQVLKLAPGHPIVLQGRAATLLKLARTDDAIADYEMGLAQAPQDLNMLTGVAAAYLMAHQPDRAEAAAMRALALAPEDQTGLAMLGTAWRLQNSEREQDLYRYDDFIQVFDLEPPSGFADMASFNRELDTALDPLHSDTREHIDQSLRGGTQTAGNIFAGKHALIDLLRPRIEEAVHRYIAGLPKEANHPFLGRRGRGFQFAGAWSSRLKDQGFHANHIHPGGWISSAYYVAVPETVRETQQGWIKFGEPSYDVGLPVRRMVQPAPGRLVLFPSYLWHGTEPFHSPQARTTIAFDVIPTR